MNRAFLSAGNGSRSPKPISAEIFRAEIPLGRIALGVTALAFTAFLGEGVLRAVDLYRAAEWDILAEVVIGRGLAAFFLFGALVY